MKKIMIFFAGLVVVFGMYSSICSAAEQYLPYPGAEPMTINSPREGVYRSSLSSDFHSPCGSPEKMIPWDVVQNTSHSSRLNEGNGSLCGGANNIKRWAGKYAMLARKEIERSQDTPGIYDIHLQEHCMKRSFQEGLSLFATAFGNKLLANNDGHTMLHCAAGSGDIKLVDHFVQLAKEQQISLAIPDESQRTLLHWAVYAATKAHQEEHEDVSHGEYITVVDYLIGKDARLKQMKDSFGKIPADYATAEVKQALGGALS